MLFTEKDYYKVVIFIVESNCFLTANSQRDHYKVVIFNRGKQLFTDSKCYLQRETIIKL